MKAIQLAGAGGKWAIDIFDEAGKWLPRIHVWRTEGDTGTTIFFDTKEEAEAQIAVLEKGGEQAAYFKYDPTKAVAPVETIAEAKERKRGK